MTKTMSVYVRLFSTREHLNLKTSLFRQFLTPSLRKADWAPGLAGPGPDPDVSELGPEPSLRKHLSLQSRPRQVRAWPRPAVFTGGLQSSAQIWPRTKFGPGPKFRYIAGPITGLLLG